MAAPLPDEGFHLSAHLIIFGEEQGARWVATLQADQRFFEKRYFVAHFLLEDGGIETMVKIVSQQVSQAVGTHPKAAGIIDRRRPSLKMPGNIQRRTDHDQRRQKECHQSADQLGAEFLELNCHLLQPLLMNLCAAKSENYGRAKYTSMLPELP